MENQNPFSNDYRFMLETLSDCFAKLQAIDNPAVLHISKPIESFLLEKIRFLNFNLGNPIAGEAEISFDFSQPLSHVLGKQVIETKVD